MIVSRTQDASREALTECRNHLERINRLRRAQIIDERSGILLDGIEQDGEGEANRQLHHLASIAPHRLVSLRQVGDGRKIRWRHEAARRDGQRGCGEMLGVRRA